MTIRSMGMTSSTRSRRSPDEQGDERTGTGMVDTAATASSVPRRQQVQLGPMHVPKASDVLANDLRERILRSEYPEGTALPPERELVLQTRMSRTTVREALRIL